MTPYEKFKSLPAAETYLRPGITIKKLDDIANQMSDNEFAERMVKARSNFFNTSPAGQSELPEAAVFLRLLLCSRNRRTA
jgi:hypothetical protein